MPTSSTPPLTIKQAYLTAGPKLTLILDKPYASPLFIYTIVVTRTVTGVVAASVTPGTDAANGGKIQLQVDDATFTSIRAQAVVGGTVILTNDTTTLALVQVQFGTVIVAIPPPVIAPAIALAPASPNPAE